MGEVRKKRVCGEGFGIGQVTRVLWVSSMWTVVEWHDTRPAWKAEGFRHAKREHQMMRVSAMAYDNMNVECHQGWKFVKRNASPAICVPPNISSHFTHRLHHPSSSWQWLSWHPDHIYRPASGSKSEHSAAVNASTRSPLLTRTLHHRTAHTYRR